MVPYVVMINAPDDQPLVEKFLTHLGPLKQQGLMRIWSVDEVLPGQNRLNRLLDEVSRADIVLVLLSSALFRESFFEEYISPSLDKADANTCHVIPVLLRPVNWNMMPRFARLQPLPRDEKPIASREDPDAGWVEVVKGLRAPLDEIRTGRVGKVTLRTPDGRTPLNASAAATPMKIRLDLLAVLLPPQADLKDFNDGSFFGESTVLGFSEDGRWAALLSIHHVGMKCDEATIEFVHIAKPEDQNRRFPLFSEIDLDEARTISIDELRMRVEPAQRFSEHVGIVKSTRLFRSLYNAKQPPVSFELGPADFPLRVVVEDNHSGLALNYHDCWPVRLKALLVEDFYNPSEASIEAGERAKHLFSVCEISFCPFSNMIAIGVQTNSEHSCWGTHEIRFVFCSIDEITEQCRRLKEL